MKNAFKSAPPVVLLLILFAACSAFGQASYSGFVGEAPVTFVTEIYSDGAAYATYVYDEFDEPIRLEGTLSKKTLRLLEKDARKLTRATLTFGDFDAQNQELKGIWRNSKTGKTLDIKLKKDFEFGDGAGGEAAAGDVIQTDSFPDKYLKVMISNDRAVAVKIFEKKTDRLFQKIDFDCQQRGTESISIGDYNFDGIKDFSIFESSYAGPNTSSLYFLYDPVTKEFFDSGYEGTSLEFDAKKKLISMTNQCCAGSSVITATYKVVKNKMVLVSENCFRWDEKRGRQVKRPIEQCQ